MGTCGERGRQQGRCWATAVRGARPLRGSGEAAAPAYLLAVQALQVDDERLVVFLAPGDLGERRGSLAQQLLLRQLETPDGGEETLLEPSG